MPQTQSPMPPRNKNNKDVPRFLKLQKEERVRGETDDTAPLHRCLSSLLTAEE